MGKDRGYLKELLPVYDPPDEVWNQLTKQLGQDLLQKMPDYEPEDGVWKGVEKSLEVRTIELKPSRWVKVAIAIVSAGLGLLWSVLREENKVLITEEAFDERLLLDESSEVDTQYDRLMQVCFSQKEVCLQSDFVRLRGEFELLRRATDDIHKAAGNYNHDPGLVAEHVVLEQQKALVLNELAKFI